MLMFNNDNDNENINKPKRLGSIEPTSGNLKGPDIITIIQGYYYFTC